MCIDISTAKTRDAILAACDLIADFAAEFTGCEFTAFTEELLNSQFVNSRCEGLHDGTICEIKPHHRDITPKEKFRGTSVNEYAKFYNSLQ